MVFAYSIIAIVVGFVIARHSPVAIPDKAMADLPSWLLYAPGLCVIIPYCWLGIRFQHLSPRTLFCYPPVWLAAVLATLGMFFLDRWYLRVHEQQLPIEFWQLAIGSQLLGVFISALARAEGMPKRLLNARQTEPDSANFHSYDEYLAARQEYQRLKWREWILSERPATVPDDDRFEFASISADIATRLVAPFGKDTTIGLVGSFGCGKSSIIQFIEFYVTHTKERRSRSRVTEVTHDSFGGPNTIQVLVCPVDCWGFDDAGTAIEHILSKAIKRISRLADCTRLLGLPTDYHQLVGMEKNTTISIANFLLGNPDPISRLSGLTHILEAINARLVLAIENLDRPKAGKFDPQDVLALLSRLKEGVPGVSYILTGSASTNFDFSKLCDYRHDIPNLDPGRIVELWEVCFSSCEVPHRTFPDKRRTPYLDQQDDALFELRGLSRPHPIEMLKNIADNDKPAEWLASLPWTPRQLKLMLRHVEDAWNGLAGEINFTDLFIVQALRFAVPDAYDFLVLHVDEMRIPLQKSQQSVKPVPKYEYPPEITGMFPHDRVIDQTHQLVVRWEALTKAATWNPEIVSRLIVYLLPQFNQLLKLGPLTPKRCAISQGIRFSQPTDYWRRILLGRVMESDWRSREVKDQDVLAAIDASQQETPDHTALVKGLLYHENYWETVYRMMQDVSLKHPLSLTNSLINSYLDNESRRVYTSNLLMAITWIFEDSDGFDYEREHTDHLNEDVVAWWNAMVKRLVLAGELQLCTFFWSRHFYFRDLDVANNVRRLMCDQFRESFKIEDVSTWFRHLSDRHGKPTLAEFFYFTRNNTKRPTFVFPAPEHWRDYAEPLFNVARADAKSLFISFALLVFRSSERNSVSKKVEERVDVLNKMFGQLRQQVLEFLSYGVETEGYYEEQFVAGVQDSSRRLLAADE